MGSYAGAVIAMGTMHGKERQVAPAFADELGAHVFAPVGIDTDQFGTFTADVARPLAPLATATAKARLAMSVAGVPYGVASEASYDTWFGTLVMHEEILVFVDDTRAIQVAEGVNTPGSPGAPQLVHAAAEALLAARRFGFPSQAAVVRATADDGIHVFGKGITSPRVLVEAVAAAVAAAGNHQVWVEPDLRAHHNPSRRDVLIALARRLARRLATPCPECGCPGYGKVGVRAGLPCQACGWPTTAVAADIHGCPACGHRDSIARAVAAAEPRYCPQCNP
ncbi:hypothetical protein I546_6274 [Mycobacterium kansasii 732]|nr:hypothetical protein I546_6274 [Mycobacterium kansasii 732]